ncbi:MAG: Dabb family protein [Caldilineaceae bacterium]|nr:Dabb family protein [Caldilineaceae bacterium]
MPESQPLLRHVVLFKFKEGTTPEQITEIENAFRGLPAKIDAIHDFEWGVDVSIEGRADGYTHCFFVTFKDEDARAVYLPHPDHKAFGAVLRPHVEKVLVLDYWVKNG